MSDDMIRTPEGSRLKIAAAALALWVAFLVPPPAKADDTKSLYGLDLADVGLTERISVDRTSGVAIGGYDPVAYFVDGHPVVGSAVFEAIWAGAAWRFANEGNRAAFLADPDVYAPKFGGYDALSVQAGVASPADPKIFAVRGDHLYLFRNAPSRDAFVGSSDRADAAEAAWPVVEKRLIR